MSWPEVIVICSCLSRLKSSSEMGAMTAHWARVYKFKFIIRFIIRCQHYNTNQMQLFATAGRHLYCARVYKSKFIIQCQHYNTNQMQLFVVFQQIKSRSFGFRFRFRINDLKYDLEYGINIKFRFVTQSTYGSF